ncbi:MAG TPA: hypothetical protein PLM91_02960 [Bacillota bacterium]|nr:hypothetical protein [Bacillota bacterium]HOL51145.1 hypothetical protein [Bacillota bacterium]HPQ01962.1 hypothetical protein [Bacillota bacterium]
MRTLFGSRLRDTKHRRLLKAVVTANRLYGLMDTLMSAFLNNLTPSEIQTLAA